ncbi:MAG: APC family permease [Candidatus Vogelbacteria bacterium]|nr:APC family permease [Candidatus Vogelbacteria bacterium]
MKTTFGEKLSSLIFGPRLPNSAVSHQKLAVLMGLAIFAPDALSSVAYATDEMLIAMDHMGFGHEYYFVAILVALLISGIIFALSGSYSQVVKVFPQGGGVYNVAKATLGNIAAQIGASSLMVDYVLTLAVSVTAGVSAIIAAYPSLADHRVGMCLTVIWTLTWLSLRGMKENALVLAFPVYFFIGSFYLMIGYGFYAYLTGKIIVTATGVATHGIFSALGLISIGRLARALSFGQLVKVIASGCTATTGIEAVSNGTPALKAPEWETASKIMTIMAVILSTMFVGITTLACLTGAHPIENQTIVSQISTTLFGNGWTFKIITAATTMMLFVAAGTAFADFPRVQSILAEDGYMPSQFMNLGSRLVFTSGIVTLAVLASALIVFFNGDLHAIMPLYAIGVFLSFSTSQLGMVVKWYNSPEIPFLERAKKIVINATGCVATTTVLISEIYSKFFEGGWILIPTIILIICFMRFISNYYKRVAAKLAINGNNANALPRKTVVVMVSNINRASLHAINLAKEMKPEYLRILHVALNAQKAEKLTRDLKKYVPDVELVTIISEYRDLINPALDYLRKLDPQFTDDEMTVIIPEIVPDRWWGYWLHNQTATLLREAIIADPEINAQVMEAPIKVGSKS